MRKLKAIFQDIMSLQNELSYEVDNMIEKYTHFIVKNVKQDSNISLIGQVFKVAKIEVMQKKCEIHIINENGRRFLLDHVEMMDNKTYEDTEYGKVFSLEEYKRKIGKVA